MLSLDQAMQALNVLANQATVTYNQVKAIVDQVDSASKTSNGILYSGKVTNSDGSLPDTFKIANDVAASSNGKFGMTDGTKLKANVINRIGDVEMYEITAVRSLTAYEHYADVTVYEYKDKKQKFYFDADFRILEKGVVENGALISPYRYDVAVSRIGKTHWGGYRDAFCIRC